MDISKFFITEDITVIQALKLLDELGNKVLFVQKDEKLCAALTDGDIRRWILAAGSLDEPIKSIANYNPLYLRDCERNRALQFLKEKSVEAVPIVDDHFRIIDIVCWNERVYSKGKSQIDIPVVMMAGGKGTRLYPYTKILPKPLIPIGELPISEHIINQFKDCGCKEFYLVVNHKKNMIKAYYNEIEKDYELFFIEEEIPLGTGGGLSLLKGKITSTFILTNCDILINEDFSKIYDFHKQQNNIITMICSLKNFQIPYGTVTIGENGELMKMEEKPKLSFFSNTGCYVVEPKVIEDMKEGVTVGFPDIIEKYKELGLRIGVYPIGEGAWLDMGQMDELEKMQLKLSGQNER